MSSDTRPQMGDELLPCPFCGAPAEMDAAQGYLAIPSGKLGSRVTIYCTSCAADMGWCREDHPDMPVEEMIWHVREDWNRRASLPQMGDEELRSEMIKTFRASMLDEVKDLANPHFGTKRPDILEAGCRAIGYINPKDAAEKTAAIVVDAMLAAMSRGRASLPQPPAGSTGEVDYSHGFHIFIDGNMWCAVGPHFRDLQQDRAGFGSTPKEAYAAWWEANARCGGFRTGWAKPPFEKFQIHPASTPAQSGLVEALKRIRHTPSRPFPDRGAHSERAFSEAVWRAWSDIQRIADEALSHAPSKPAPVVDE